ncbi:MAG TPA: hypothetical protein VI278_01570 [Nitrososphaeraceae archaeon]
MIGTPNAGSPIAQSSDICEPAIEDLKPAAADTRVAMNSNTKYYIIAGDYILLYEAKILLETLPLNIIVIWAV